MRQITAIILVITFGLAFLPTRSHAQQALQRTGTYYAVEFKSFNSKFANHLELLADCLDKTFQGKSKYHDDPIDLKTQSDCKKSENGRAGTLELLQMVSPVICSYVKILSYLQINNYTGNEYNDSLDRAKDTFTFVAHYAANFGVWTKINPDKHSDVDRDVSRELKEVIKKIALVSSSPT